MPTGWMSPKFPSGLLPFVALLTVVQARDVVFFQTSRCIFLPEFWELERLGKPVNKDLAGDQGLQDC